MQLACAVLVVCVGCSEIVEPGSLDAGVEPREGAGAAAGTDATASSGDGPHSRRCVVTPADPRPCEAGELQLGYYGHLFADELDAPCMPVEQNYCDHSPPPFATLSECLAECDSDAGLSTTTCQQPGELEPACESTEGAELARLDAGTPFGELHLTRAWLERVHGFLIGISVLFTARLDARFDARPSVEFTLYGPFDGTQHLIGEHDVHARVTLCDRTFEVPVRVTVTADELSSGASERFEATFDSLAPDIELSAEVAFSRVCILTNSL